jgi:hypothetical protein
VEKRERDEGGRGHQRNGEPTGRGPTPSTTTDSSTTTSRRYSGRLNTRQGPA